MEDELKQVTHNEMADKQAFQKVHMDMRKCFVTWEEAGISPTLAVWAMVARISDTLRLAYGNDRGKVAEFMLAAMNSSLGEGKH